MDLLHLDIVNVIVVRKHLWKIHDVELFGLYRLRTIPHLRHNTAETTGHHAHAIQLRHDGRVLRLANDSRRYSSY